MARDCSDGRRAIKYRRVDPPSVLSRGRQGDGPPRYTRTWARTSGVIRSVSAGTGENEVRLAVPYLAATL